MTRHSEAVVGVVRVTAKCAMSLVAFLGLMLVQTSAVKADSLTFSAGNYTQSNLLNDGSQGTSYDILSMVGLSGSSSITAGSTIDLAISAVTFTDGPSCDADVSSGCDTVSVQTGTAVFNLTVDGITQTLSVPFQACLTAGGYSISPLCTANPTDDTVQLYGSGPLTYNVGSGEQIVVSSLGLGPIVGSPTGTTEDLDAAFTLVSTPEPSSLLLLSIGLALMLFLGTKFGHLAGNGRTA